MQKSKNNAMSFFFIASLIGASFAFQISADKDRIDEVLKASSLTQDFILNTSHVNSGKYSFTYEEHMNEDGDFPTIHKASYTVENGKGVWQLESVNNEKPSDAAVSSFLKFRKHAFDPFHMEIDESTLKVEEDVKELFHYSFMVKPKSLSRDYRYYQHCTFHVRINPATKRLMSVQQVANEPFKISIIKTRDFKAETSFSWDPRFNEYVVSQMTSSMIVHLFGQDLPATEKIIYTYK